MQEGRVGPQNSSKSDLWQVRKAPESSPEVQKSSLKVQKSNLEIQSRKPVQSRIRNTADLKPESAKEEDPTGKGQTGHNIQVYGPLQPPKPHQIVRCLRMLTHARSYLNL